MYKPDMDHGPDMDHKGPGMDHGPGKMHGPGDYHENKPASANLGVKTYQYYPFLNFSGKSTVRVYQHHMCLVRPRDPSATLYAVG